jgi:hypothetical protein
MVNGANGRRVDQAEAPPKYEEDPLRVNAAEDERMKLVRLLDPPARLRAAERKSPGSSSPELGPRPKAGDSRARRLLQALTQMPFAVGHPDATHHDQRGCSQFRPHLGAAALFASG